MRRGRATTAALLLAAVSLAATSAPPGAAASARTLAVTGFIDQSGSASAIERSAAALTTVGVDGVTLDSAGDAVTTPNSSALSLLQHAHADGLRGELLVSNYDDSIADFSPRRAAALLESPANIDRVALQVAGIVRAQGWDGINVDLESLARADGAGLVAFLSALRRDLSSGSTLSIDVTAATSLADYQSLGYDLGAVGPIVDRIVLMAYDQHGPWSQPGPIGAIGWQRRSLAALLTRVSPDKVDLGVAGYGYTWPRGRPHQGVSVSDALARRLVRRDHATARWVAASGEWTATLANGTRVWWSDSRSYRLRVGLARRFALHGLALWQLATSDPLANATG